jgi:hypothetical protein
MSWLAARCGSRLGFSPTGRTSAQIPHRGKSRHRIISVSIENNDRAIRLCRRERFGHSWQQCEQLHRDPAPSGGQFHLQRRYRRMKRLEVARHAPWTCPMECEVEQGPDSNSCEYMNNQSHQESLREGHSCTTKAFPSPFS